MKDKDLRRAQAELRRAQEASRQIGRAEADREARVQPLKHVYVDQNGQTRRPQPPLPVTVEPPKPKGMKRQEWARRLAFAAQAAKSVHGLGADSAVEVEERLRLGVKTMGKNPVYAKFGPASRNPFKPRKPGKFYYIPNSR